MSQGFSGVTDSGTAGLGGIPAGCGSCGGGGSIPGDSQMMRFRWNRLWWSTWQHPGNLGRGMYSGYHVAWREQATRRTGEQVAAAATTIISSRVLHD